MKKEKKHNSKTQGKKRKVYIYILSVKRGTVRVPSLYLNQFCYDRKRVFVSGFV